MQIYNTGKDNLPILILGGGFLGLCTALHLKNLHCPRPIILINPNWRFVFKPLLYELLSGEIELDLVCPRYDELFQNSNITFILDTVRTIDLEQRQVKLNSGLSYTYRYCVLALGSTASYFSIPGAKENSFSFQSLEDVYALGQHLRRCLQQATQIDNPQERRKLLTIAIVGAGSSGVEIAATLADLLPLWYKPLGGNAQDIRIVLVQRGGEVLKEATKRLRNTAIAGLQQRAAPIEFLLGASVKTVDPSGLEFEQNETLEKLPAATVIWTAGTAVHPLIQALPIAPQHRAPKGRLHIEPTLQLPGFPEVFAAGDCAIDPQNPQPPTAQVAYQQAAAIAHNLRALIERKALTPAQVYLRGTLMKLGLEEGAAEIFDRFEVKGKLGHLIRTAAYLELLPTPARNFKITNQWLTDEIFQRFIGV